MSLSYQCPYSNHETCGKHVLFILNPGLPHAGILMLKCAARQKPYRDPAVVAWLVESLLHKKCHLLTED